MRTLIKWISIVVVIAAPAALINPFSRGPEQLFDRAEVVSGEITTVIKVTGTARPVTTVPIGAVVPGKVVKVHVATNASVKKGQVLAEVDNMPNADPAKVICTIDGVVLEKRIEEGQTLTGHEPNLFTIASDLRKEIYINGSVNKTERDQIEKTRSQPVSFAIDNTDTVVEGKVQEIGINPEFSNNVTTYPVVISVANPDLKLLPGTTGTLKFQIEKREGVVKIPNAALRFFPDKKEMVRPEDQRILDGTSKSKYVWMVAGHQLRAVEVSEGLKDNEYTEQTSGTLQPGDMVVTGLK